jgi:iron complex outermembrane receptor protein
MPAKGVRITYFGILRPFSKNLIEMKYFFMGITLCLSVIFTRAQTTAVFNDTSLLQPVEINSIRAADKTPVAKTTLSKPEIAKNNIGQDLPFILNQTPSCDC